MKKGFTSNIEKLALENNKFRQVLYTASNIQLVLMSLKAGEEIGKEIHDVDQFLRIEKGNGKAIIDDISHEIADGSVVVVPAGSEHNVVNSGESDMKLYSLYAPPHHLDGTIHQSKKDAEADTEHFDGQTSE